MIDIRRNEDHAILRPRFDQLDASRSDELKQRLRAVLDEGCRHIVLDLQDVDFLDSTTLGVLVAAMRHAGGKVHIVLARAHPDVLGVFRLTGLDRVFPVFPSAEAAAAALAARVR